MNPGHEIVPASRPAGMEMLAVHPSARRPAVIADANALIADSVRRTRRPFAILPFLAERRLITLVTAEHIDAKVYARLPRACRKGPGELAAATYAYETYYRPLLRLVDVGALMLNDPRVRSVELVDREDTPVAQLGVLLAPSLVLTWDAHLLDADIGSHDWANALVLLKQLVELDMMMRGAGGTVVAAAGLTVQGVAGLVRQLRRSELVLGILIGLSLALGYQYREQLRAAPQRLKQAGGPLIEQLLAGISDVVERRQRTAQRLHGTLVSPPAALTLEAEVARALIPADQPLPAAAVHSRLPFAWRVEVTVEQVMSVLRNSPPFELVRGRGWALGHRPQPQRGRPLLPPPSR